MLSILIPVYNYDISQLVTDLHAQAMGLNNDWEIRVLDDASSEEWKNKNRHLAALSQVHYKELDQNIGRAAIRNRLAEQSRYDYLLFMDCDSGVGDRRFLANYYQRLSPEMVHCGGRTYEAELPGQAYRLHWQYGRAREVKTATQRNENAHEGFMTNNFVVPKAIYQRIQLDERLKQYGHEDTLFGLELKAANIRVVHLDNPLLHLGLEEARGWLVKQQQAIENLYWLQQEHSQLNTRALTTWRKARRLGLLTIGFSLWEKQAQRWSNELITASKPSLWKLDMLKVIWLEGAKRMR